VFPDRVAAAAERIDPNTASAASLRRLHPLGPVRAAAIVEYRKSHGPVAFRTLEDLDSVPGLGMATLGQFQEHLSLPDGAK
jgi:competence protein ComEA